jgi:hypothetical protein
MRLSEQYNTEWHVNVAQRLLTVPRSKHGETRHIPLNSVVTAAFKRLALQANGSKYVFLNHGGRGAPPGQQTLVSGRR